MSADSPSLTGQPVTTPNSQRDMAYDSLHRLLVLQKIPPGERLREPIWSTRLGVNRTALREAFARLEAEGWLAKGQRTGYFVPKLNEEDISEILIVRTTLECCAIELLCEKGLNTTRKLQALKDACDQLAEMVRNNYLLGVSEADRRFHEKLIELTGNKRLKAVYHRAPLPMVHDEIVQSQFWEEECRITLEEHHKIYQAILDNQPPEAIKILRHHLSERYLLPLRA